MCEKENSIFSGTGYSYLNAKNEPFIEFHIDDNEKFKDMITNPFGGNLSVRIPTNQPLLIIFGQDECIFKQYSFRKKGWCGPKGETPLMAKDDGQGVMISAFVSRDYGFEWELTKEELDRVNEKRENL